ncbi:hypothetical protein [Phormidium sp. FACHB-1136]|uniref:hypothetical protein n=1 Tax=Phormidium sp. FACHB-1136 TaxID=2692848 RepID=UPI001688D1BA|nr:hypothetical protein [Phormidium sp. FACHB-1136]MBD2424774.1 hypothetical protein [Phormidium sp. FACHB-1136]
MSSTDIRQRAMALLDQLPHTKLAAVVQLLEVLAEPISPPSESHPSGDFDQARLEDLRERCEWCELSEAEHQELIQYEDRLEQDRAERLEALMNLAKLRNLDLSSLNRQLVSSAPPFHVA